MTATFDYVPWIALAGSLVFAMIWVGALIMMAVGPIMAHRKTLRVTTNVDRTSWGTLFVVFIQFVAAVVICSGILGSINNMRYFDATRVIFMSLFIMGLGGMGAALHKSNIPGETSIGTLWFAESLSFAAIVATLAEANVLLAAFTFSQETPIDTPELSRTWFAASTCFLGMAFIYSCAVEARRLVHIGRLDSAELYAKQVHRELLDVPGESHLVDVADWLHRAVQKRLYPNNDNYAKPQPARAVCPAGRHEFVYDQKDQEAKKSCERALAASEQLVYQLDSQYPESYNDGVAGTARWLRDAIAHRLGSPKQPKDLDLRYASAFDGYSNSDINYNQQMEQYFERKDQKDNLDMKRNTTTITEEVMMLDKKPIVIHMPNNNQNAANFIPAF